MLALSPAPAAQGSERRLTDAGPVHTTRKKTGRGHVHAAEDQRHRPVLRATRPRLRSCEAADRDRLGYGDVVDVRDGARGERTRAPNQDAAGNVGAP